MKFSFKPVFIGWLTLLTQLPLQLFFTLWSAIFFGGMTSFLFPNSKIQFIFFGALAFFGIPLVIYAGKKLNYSHSEYKFFEDRLEFEEGFFSLSRKVIKLRDVKEVTLRKGIFQRQYGLGSIYLATQATGTWGSWGSPNAFSAMGFGSISASGVILRDIFDPDDAYQRISELIERNR
jgi:membrane protein YdbS with pleckstrin-like domain